MHQSAIWIHDAGGDREISSEGFASSPRFSSDGKTLYWLRRESIGANAELWVTNLASGKGEPALSGFAMDSYDIAADEKQVVFAASKGGAKSQIWLASLNRLEPPKPVTPSRTDTPFFGSQGELIFRFVEEKASFLERIKLTGQARSRIIPGTIIFLYSVSPDGAWAMVRTPVTGEDNTIAAVAVPLQGGPLVRICLGSAAVRWGPDERFIYIPEVSGRKRNRTLVLPIVPGKALPELPASGIRSFEEGVTLPGARVIEQAGVAPGPDPSTYAYTKTTVHRNLFRIPLP